MDSLSRGNTAECDLADHLRLRHIGNVEDDPAAVAVGKICSIAFDMRRTMAGKLQAICRRALCLLRQREAANFAWIAGIGDVDDPINLSGHARSGRRRMNQGAAIVKIAMRAGAAGFELTDLPR